MKTRNIIAILAALPVMAGFTGCKSDDEVGSKPAKEILMLTDGNTIEYRASEEGPATGISIVADCRWTVEVDKGTFGDDLIVSPRQGSGNGTLVIVSNQNTELDMNREATITLISDGGLHQKVTVRQMSLSEGELTIDHRSFNFAADATEAQLLTISSKSNTNWNVQVPAGVNWVHLDQNSGTGGGTIQISVDHAVSDVVRTATLAIAYGNKVAEIEVSQEPLANITLDVSTNELERFLTEGGERTFRVESNAAWRAFVPSSAQSWLHIEPAEGIGNGEVRVVCDPNENSSRPRLSLIIVVAGTADPKQADILVEQAPGEGRNVPEQDGNPNPQLAPRL